MEDALFSNRKYHEMAREIERLSAGNYKLRSRLRDMECLVEAERKRNTRERVEFLEKKVEQLKSRLEEKENIRPDIIVPVEVLPAGHEVAVTSEFNYDDKYECVNDGKKGWSTIKRVRKI